MKNKKAKFLPFIFLFTISLAYLASAQTTIALNSTNNIVQLSSLEFNPYPVVPGEYFDFYIAVQYIGDSGASGSSFQLVPSFPFSLNPGDNGTISFGELSSPSIVLHYKVKVDPNAGAGPNTINLNYNIGNELYTQTFNIDVENPKTDFDAVIQSVSGNAVSIAIANTGENVANAVIVKIPDQNDFTAVGTNGQMVGNLNSGDYTVVSFTLSPKRNITTISQQPLNSQPSANSQNYQAYLQSQSPKTLNFEIDYTDTVGERRIVNMSLPLTLTNVSGVAGSGNFSGRRTQTQSLFVQWYFWVIVAALIIAGIIVYKKVANSKAKKFSNNPSSKISKGSKKRNDKNNSEEVPDWIKNVKEKEKK